jgi:serine protease AprX
MKTRRGIETWSRRFLAAGAVLGLTLAALPSASAQGSSGAAKLSPDVERTLQQSAHDDLVGVIIQTAGEPSSAHFTRLHGRGGFVKNRYTAISGYAGKVPAGQLAALAEDPEVVRVSSDAEVKTHLDVALKAVKADLARLSSYGMDGRGVGVAVIDTGVNTHEDLSKLVESGKLIRVEVMADANNTSDQYGHGTHVAGIIGGSGYASGDAFSFRTFKGLAPGARIISIRALYADGSGFVSDIIAGIDWAIANRALYNIRVINLSLGHPVFESYKTDPLCRALRAAYDAGIVVVASAGNDGGVGTGFGTITSPANEPTAVTVGAMDDRNTAGTSDDVLAWFSSRGPTLIDYVVKPDLVAPGTKIVSLRANSMYLDTNYHQYTVKEAEYRLYPGNADRDGAYYTLSGTSMAAPMVSAAAALMLQKEPGLNPATVKARLMVSTVKDGLLVFETGAGYLDIDAALMATGYAASASSPTAVLAADGTVYIDNTALIWGGSLIWSDTLIWGDALIWGGTESLIWDQTLIWGLNKGSLYGIVLTDVPESIVTTNGSVWGRNGNAGPKSIIDNALVTADSIIWGGGASVLDASTDTVGIMGAVWTDKKGGRP